MTIEQKKQILNQNFTNNYQDYFKIVEKICNNRKRHQSIGVEDILTIIYLNIEKRLNKLEDLFFDDYNQFRALFINTTQSQIMWGNSDITQHTTKLSLGHSNVVFEDAENEIDITNTPLRINGERISQINEELNDDFDAKFNFINEQYPQLFTTNCIDAALYRLVIKEHNSTNIKFHKSTNISVTSSSKILSTFKNKIKFIYDNHQYIRFKPSLSQLADLHPEFSKRLVKAINTIETKHSDVYLVITEGFISIRDQFELNKISKKKEKTLSNYGLRAKIALFDDEGPLEFNSSLIANFNKENITFENGYCYLDGLNIDDIKTKFTNKEFIGNTNWVKI